MSDTGRGAGCGTRRMKYPELNQVRLLPGSPFYNRQQDMNAFLLGQDPDSMLYNFRKASGLPVGTAEPMTGWDADECKLKGHTTGHYMSGLALAYAATGDERFRERLAYIVTGLRECQEAFARSGRTAYGFLSAYDEEQFDLLEQYTKYPEIWAPYYTLDKIMSGLLDAYELAGLEQALGILEPLGDWVYARLSMLPDEQRNKMWSMYIAGEYGAMIGTMVRLSRLTGKSGHLAAARFFENPALFDQMAAGSDGLDTMHANQHIPQIMGAVELYRETGERKYLDIADNFWRIVTGHHCYSIGGTGEEERWHAADSETSYLTEKTAESCASYNMLRLTAMLFGESGLLMSFYPRCGYTEQETGAENADIADIEGDNCADCVTGSDNAPDSTTLMDYFELTLFNHILMSCSHAPDGGTTYFLPLAPGSTKYYEREENSCCHGTGMESRYRYMQQIFSYQGDDMLLVNLPISSRLEGEENITVRFESGYDGSSGECAGEELREDCGGNCAATGAKVNSDGNMIGRSAYLRITADRDMTRRLAVRIPDWACLGERKDEMTGRYRVTDRPLMAGEVLEIRLPMEIREIRAKSDPEYTSLAYGPYLLAAISDSKEYLSAEEVRKSIDCRKSFAVRPLYQIDGEPYHIYFR